MIHPAGFINGAFTLLFLLGAYYFFIISGIRDQGKRGVLLIGANLLIGPAFLFELIAEAYENETIELLSHGLTVGAGILFLLSFYMSTRAHRTTRGGSI